MHRSDVKSSVLEAIGGTPLVELGRLHDGPGRLLVKLESQNPGGSIKDRPARTIILHARERGQLRVGQPVFEMTSGNMGAGLAVVCGALGHPFVAAISAGNSRERTTMMRALGARVHVVPQVDGTPGNVTGADIAAAEQVARAQAELAGGYYVDQFSNPDSTLAHEQGTGPEMWEQLRGEIHAFVASVGTGGTFVGTSRFLKTQRANIVCVAVEPEGAAVLAGCPVSKPRHVIQGMGYGRVPPLWEPHLADAFMEVGDAEASDTARLLAEKEGLFVGFSSGANVAAALRLLRGGTLPGNPNVVTVLCDIGLKYGSSLLRA